MDYSEFRIPAHDKPLLRDRMHKFQFIRMQVHHRMPSIQFIRVQTIYQKLIADEPMKSKN